MNPYNISGTAHTGSAAITVKAKVEAGGRTWGSRQGQGNMRVIMTGQTGERQEEGRCQD